MCWTGADVKIASDSNSTAQSSFQGTLVEDYIFLSHKTGTLIYQEGSN